MIYCIIGFMILGSKLQFRISTISIETFGPDDPMGSPVSFLGWMSRDITKFITPVAEMRCSI